MTLWFLAPKMSTAGSREKASRAAMTTYMDTISCIGDLGYTPPGEDESAKFYAPGEFTKNGTITTTTNIDGGITNPLSGATFTWTHGNVTHPITVAKADARPTVSSSGNSNGDEEHAAPAIVPRLWPIIALVVAVLV
ncbi:hypothetical protein FDECE_13550 [Fusarium decemcellulare]|nr:hypothetical protein FDECE_13550 [Fusarium decemcellulare]